MQRKALCLLCFVAFAGFQLFSNILCVPSAQAGVTIIVNPSIKTDTMTKDEVKDIFTGKIILLDGNQQITLVTGIKSEAHEEFVKAYTHKTPAQFTSYWKKLVFTGKGSSPKTFDSDKEIIDYVSKTKGAIGYIASGTTAEGVRVVKITDR